MKFTARAVARAQFAVWIAKIRASKHDFVLAAPPTRRTGRTNSCHLLRRHRQQCGPRRAEQVHERYHLHRPGRSSRLLELQALRPRWRRSSWAPVPTSPIRRCRRHRGSLRAEGGDADASIGQRPTSSRRWNRSTSTRRWRRLTSTSRRPRDGLACIAAPWRSSWKSVGSIRPWAHRRSRDQTHQPSRSVVPTLSNSRTRPKCAAAISLAPGASVASVCSVAPSTSAR
jgi:hypothetical protein